MRTSHLPIRLALALTLGLVALGTSACYKNAGENVQPTANRVDLSDLQTPTVQTTRTPAPTGSGTPATQAPAASDGTQDAEDQANVLGPTPTQLDLFGPSGDDATAAPTASAPAEPGIATPGMSDIRPSATPGPTLNPAQALTATQDTSSVQAGTDECVHVVQSGDSLFSIATENNVEVADLVAANPDLLTGGELTTLQIGWELRMPGCGDVPAPQPTAPTAQASAPAATPATVAPGGGPTTHVVQAGDTVFSIAQQYGVSPDAIIQANGLTVQGNVAYITVGQELIIPAAQ